MKNYVLILLITLFGSTAVAQEYNYVDENEMRQGKWRKFHVDSEKLFYTGQFLNDKPVGEFIYYYKSGKTKGLMQYDQIGMICNSEAFYGNGSLMAVGKYINQEKDSTWNYYAKNKTLKSVENWKKGVKHGVETSFFEDGSIAELITWEDGIREGKWEQYFSKDKPKVIGEYVDDAYDGEMTFYYPNGKQELSGKYVNGFRDGTWYYYNEDGSIYMQTLYSQGKVLKEKKETGVFREFTADNIMLSEINYKQGKKEGYFKIYHEGAEWVMEEVVDPQTEETYNKRVVSGHNLKMTGQYSNDKFNGIIKHYNNAGVFTREEYFVGGVLK